MNVISKIKVNNIIVLVHVKLSRATYFSLLLSDAFLPILLLVRGLDPLKIDFFSIESDIIEPFLFLLFL